MRTDLVRSLLAPGLLACVLAQGTAVAAEEGAATAEAARLSSGRRAITVPPA